MTRYVHLNPVFVRSVKEKSIEERVQYLREYPWSSYRTYIGRGKPFDFVDFRPILALMDVAQQDSQSAYRRFVEVAVSDVDAAFVETFHSSPLCIGSSEFLDWAKGIYNDLLKKTDSSEDVSFRRIGRRFSPEKVLSVLSEELKIDSSTISRRQRGGFARPMAAALLNKYCGLCQREIAKILNLVTGAAVSAQLRSLRDKCVKDKNLNRLMDRIGNKIERD